MKALLALEDGFVLEGRSFTGPCEGGGEVIFNTGMTGYQEILTDPSYYGQMVCMTWPLIGNYGINAEDMESGKVHAAALIVKECCKTPSNWRSVCSLPDFLQQHGVPGIECIDTRALTRHLRMHGAMRGMVSTSITDPAELVMQAKSLPSMEGQNLVTRVMPATPWKWTGNGGVPAELNADGSYNWPGEGPRLVAYDFGIKWNILRLLTEQGFDVLVVPPSFTAEQVKASGAQAVFLSNEGAVTGFLAATADGSDLADGGRFADLIVAGFDAGSPQKNAVRQGWFVGSVTQDPYRIGYLAVELAVKAANGEEVADVDTGAQWYTAENIDDPDIALLVYD